MTTNKNHELMFTAFVKALTNEDCTLACLDAIDNVTGSERLVLAIATNEDGEKSIIPLAVFINPEEEVFSKKYTLISNEMRFVDDVGNDDMDDSEEDFEEGC